MEAGSREAAEPVLGVLGGRADRWAGKWSAARACVAVTAFSVAVRLLVLAAVWYAPFASDARDYLGMARQLLTGAAFVPYWPAGVPLMLAPLLQMGMPVEALRLLPLLFWVLCCWSLYRLLESLGMAGWAWAVLLLFSLLPDAVQMSLEPMTQMPAAALVLLVLSAAVRLIQGSAQRWPEAVLLGVGLGALCLVRPSTAVLVLALPLAVLVFARQVTFARRLGPAALALALAAVMIGAWVAQAHRMTGRYVINTANSVNLFYGNNPWTPDYRTWYFGSHAKLASAEIRQFPEYAGELRTVYALPELDRPAAFQALATAEVKAHPVRFLWRTSNRVRAFLGFDTFTSAALSQERVAGVRLLYPALLLEAAVYLALMLPAVYLLACAPGAFWRTGVVATLAGSILLYSAPYFLSMSHPTYHFAVLLPFAALGLAAWRQGGWRLHRTRGWVAVAVLLLVQVEWIWQAAQGMRQAGG